ncbi:transcription init factor put [Enterospora canceri]|uniref:Transcription init factor put n=1 Tax=Enterospora canceri TaxID=1081671 RepID=A0A1Y1S6U8_9MICR|nr:transcription init factor put [Enterospora canceri]
MNNLLNWMLFRPTTGVWTLFRFMKMICNTIAQQTVLFLRVLEAKTGKCLAPKMSGNQGDESLLPRDAKIISAILRSLGIEECEPRVIVQLLEFAYKYSTGVMLDAQGYARHCESETITQKDIKLAIQTKSSQQFLPAPSRNLLQATAESINKNPLSMPDAENLIRVPNLKSGMYGMEFELGEADETNNND